MEITKKSKKKKLKYSCEELLLLDAIEVYKLLLQGKICRFPMGFWERPEAKDNAVVCTKFLIEKILQWTDDDIKKHLRVKTMISHKLGGMMQKVYKNSPYDCINSAYPDRFKPWDLAESPSSIWTNPENRITAIKYIINEKLQWSREDICENFSARMLKENGISGILEYTNYSPFVALEEAFPGEFKRWEIKLCSMPSNHWNIKANRLEALNWLYNEKLNCSLEDVVNVTTKETFSKYRLSTVFARNYKGNPFNVANEMFPNKFKPWDFPSTGVGYWENHDNVRYATKWLIFDILGMSEEESIANLTSKHFTENKLSGLIAYYSGNMVEILSIAFGRKINPWEVNKSPVGFWSKKENRVSAIKWMLDELNIDLTNSPELSINNQNLKKVGLCKIRLSPHHPGMAELRKEYLESLDLS